MRKKSLDFNTAYRIQREAEALMADHEYDVDSFEVLTLALDSGCSAYNCEFVAMAKQIGVKLVTEDANLRRVSEIHGRSCEAVMSNLIGFRSRALGPTLNRDDGAWRPCIPSRTSSALPPRRAAHRLADE